MTSNDSNDGKRTEGKVFVSIRSTMIFCSASRYVLVSNLASRHEMDSSTVSTSTVENQQ